MITSIYAQNVLAFIVPTQEADDYEVSGFDQIATRYLNIINYSGTLNHEHVFSFAGGLAGLIASGKGDLGGVHDSFTIYSPLRSVVNSTEKYNVKTAADALPAQYLQVVSGTEVHNTHSAQVGVEPKPGEIARVSENLATGSDRGGGFFGYNSYLHSNNGRNRMEINSEGAGASISVEGYSEVYFNLSVEGGAQRAGWWSLE